MIILVPPFAAVAGRLGQMARRWKPGRAAPDAPPVGQGQPVAERSHHEAGKEELLGQAGAQEGCDNCGRLRPHHFGDDAGVEQVQRS